MTLCKFCQQEAIYVPLKVNQKRTFEVHYCFDCKAEYLDYGTEGTATHLYTSINDKMYRWSVIESEEGSSGFIWFVGEPGEPGVRPNRKLRLLKSFDFLPAIVPANVEQKLRFMLLFL